MIDLRSDTVTRPSEAMLKAMHEAEVGDDVFQEDPTVNRLERMLAERFAQEAGLFCSSGTMTNQIAIKTHTQPGDQVICSWAAHVYNYEGGGMAMNSGVTAKLLEGNRGLFKASDVSSAILADDVHYPISKLVSIEDTSNKGGGAIWDESEIGKIRKTCQNNGLALHLDGARVFNRIIAKNTDSRVYGERFDSISICLSKGLGAPVGSVLLGPKDFIRKSRRIRKVFGGGMRQAGVLAAAGIYALENNVRRMEQDHLHAEMIASSLSENPLVESILPVESNIVIFSLKEDNSAEKVVSQLADHGILAFATGPSSIRFVLHLDISPEKAQIVQEVCKAMKK